MPLIEQGTFVAKFSLIIVIDVGPMEGVW